MALPPTNMTGAARFRRTLFGRLVLQVEERLYRDAAVRGPATRWRDAEEGELGILRLVRHGRKLDPLL